MQALRARPTWYFSGLCALAILLNLPHLTQAEEEAKPEVTLDQIKTHWQQRREKFQSVRVEWTEVITRKNFPLDHDFLGGPTEPPFGIDVTHTHRNSLLFHQGRYRHSTSGINSMTNPKKLSEWVHVENTWVADGKESREFSYTGPPTLDPPYNQLTINRDVGMAYPGNPAMTTSMNLDIPSLFSLTQFSITDKVTKNGEEFLVLTRSLHAEFGSIAEIWLEARPPYLLRETKQQTRDAEGAIVNTVEISNTYTQDPEHGWFPSGWKYRSDSQDIDAQVTSVVVEPHVQEIDFTLVPPPLTMVVNVAEDRNNYTVSFIKEDGSRRVFTQEEMRMNRPIREWLEEDDKAP